MNGFRACVKCQREKQFGIETKGEFYCGLTCLLEVLDTKRCDACGEVRCACFVDDEVPNGEMKSKPYPTAHLCTACCHFSGVMSDYYGPVVCIGCGTTTNRVKLNAA